MCVMRGNQISGITRMSLEKMLAGMNKLLLKSVLAVALCNLILSCSHEDVPGPDAGANEITYLVSDKATRGFIDNNNINTRGTIMSVFGFIDGLPLHGGTSMAMQDAGLEYAYADGDMRWIVSRDGRPVKYYWLKDGKYKFFGWLKYDAASSLSRPASWTYDEASMKLTVPETILDKDYRQFDFIYSDVHVRDMDEGNSKELGRVPVPFVMHHLFSSFGVGIRNMSDDDITITKVALEGIHEKGSAVIDFSGNLVEVAYGSTSTERAADEYFIGYNGEGYVLPKESGVKGNAFAPTSERLYYMVWPQAKDVVAPTTPFTGEGEREYAASDSLLIVEYEHGGKKHSKRVKLPDFAWEAGQRNYFEVQIADRLVELRATVLPWDYTSSQVDFSDGTVAVKEGGRLKWNEETCVLDKGARKVYVNKGQPIEATFSIDAPVGGQWRVSMEGDIAAFMILDDIPPTDDAIGPVDGEKHRIRIVPLVSNPERNYSVNLKFVVLTADGKVIAVDDMVQDEDGDGDADIYSIELQRTK